MILQPTPNAYFTASSTFNMWSISSLFLILGSILSQPCHASLTLKLRPGQEYCFAFRTMGKEPNHISGSYDMMDDGLSANPVVAVLFDFDTERVAWHSKQGEPEGAFSFTGAGKFHLCLGNGSGGYKTPEDKERDLKRMQGHPVEDDDFNYSNIDGMDRTIGFNVRVNPLSGTELERYKARNTKTTTSDSGKVDGQSSRVEELSLTLREKIALLEDHQSYMKRREASHRDVVEQTFGLVMKWTLLEAVVLGLVATLQVMYLKKFFETKRFL